MSAITCPACSGAGQVKNVVTGGNISCPLCNGTGQVSSNGLGDQYFDYVFNPPQLTADEQGVSALVNITNDADFECVYLKVNSTGLFSVQLFDQFRNKLMSSAPVNGENFAGSAQLPVVLPKPWKLLRTSVVQAVFNDRSGADNTIQLALGGYKLQAT